MVVAAVDRAARRDRIGWRRTAGWISRRRARRPDSRRGGDPQEAAGQGQGWSYPAGSMRPSAPSGPRTQPASGGRPIARGPHRLRRPRPSALAGLAKRTDDGAVYAQLIWLADAEEPIDGVHEVRVVEVILAPVDIGGATGLEVLRVGVGRPLSPAARGLATGASLTNRPLSLSPICGTRPDGLVMSSVKARARAIRSRTSGPIGVRRPAPKSCAGSGPRAAPGRPRPCASTAADGSKTAARRSAGRASTRARPQVAISAERRW